MKISIIAAVAENNVIGSKGKIPWHLPADFKHFKEITSGHHILMGQKTFESIGKPLPGRTNIVLSSDPKFKAKGCVIVHTPKEGVEFAESQGEKEIMICGGAQVYKTFLPLSDKLYITKVKAKFDGDTFFPEIDNKEWNLVSSEPQSSDEKNPFPFEFAVYIRK